MSITKNLSLREIADATNRASAPAPGNQLNDQFFNYQYDAEGRVSSVTGTGGVYWQDEVYNALGQRVEDYQDDGPNYAMTLTYPRDIFGNRTGTWDQRPSQNWTGWDVYWARVAGQRLNMGGSSSYLAHADVVGSTHMVTDQAGSVVWDSEFYPWGQLWQETGTRQYRVFAGLEWPENEVLTPSATRGYSYRVSRWNTPDSMGGDVTNPQSLNRYAYALNNPATLNDPLGLDPADSSNPASQCSNLEYYLSHAFCGGPPPGSSCGDYDLGSCYGDPTAAPCVVLNIPCGSGGGGYSGGGTASSASPAGQPPLVGGGPGYWSPGCPFPYDAMGLCGLSPDYWTAQISGSINLNYGYFSFNFSGGFAIDLHGHFASFLTTGKGATQGGSGSIGLQGAVSNADTVCGLGGPFWNASGSFGAGGSVSADIFQGKGDGPNGTVTGGGITVGGGVGGSGSVTHTTTDVTPIGSAPCH